MLIKRLLALEGDWVTIPGRIEVEKIPKVFYMLSAPGHGMLPERYDQVHTEQVGADYSCHECCVGPLLGGGRQS